MALLSAWRGHHDASSEQQPPGGLATLATGQVGFCQYSAESSKSGTVHTGDGARSGWGNPAAGGHRSAAGAAAALLKLVLKLGPGPGAVYTLSGGSGHPRTHAATGDADQEARPSRELERT
jgi:hypothetical protein